jgi:hypothetical protein
MAFQNGSYARIKETEDKGNYTKAKIVISKKIKGTDKYVCTFAGWVTFVGKAHQCRPMSGQKIKLGSCEVSNGYLDKEGNQQFSKSPQYTIYDYELQGDENSATAVQPNWETLASDDSLPF